MTQDRLSKIKSRMDVIAVTVVVILLAGFALSGSAFATEAFFFAVAFLAGYGIGYVAVTPGFPRWLHAVAGFVTSIVICMVGLTFVSSLMDLELPKWTQRLYDIIVLPNSYAYGFFLGVLIAVSSGLFSIFPTTTEEEAQEQRRRAIRNLMVVGGMLLAFVILLLLVFVILWLIAQASVYFLEYTLEDGSRMLAVAVALSSERVVLYYQRRRRAAGIDHGNRSPEGGARQVTQTEAMVWRVEGPAGHMQRQSIDGFTSVAHKSAGDRSAQNYCPCVEPTCLDVNYLCVAKNCGPA